MPAQPPLFEAKLFKHKGEDIEVTNQEAADEDCRRGEQSEMASCERYAEGKKAKSAAAFHDFKAAAGCLQPPALYREKHDGAGAASL